MTTADTARLRYNLGQWVEVTVRREGGPDLILVGKITAADRDHAVATCRTASGDKTFVYSDDTSGHVIFRRMTNADWQRRKNARPR
jgi:hypothetical protein